MTKSLVSSRLSLCVLLLAALLPLSSGEALAEDPNPVTSTIQEVMNHRFEDGSSGPFSYRVSSEVEAPVAPGTMLPPVRVDHREHAEAMAGNWGDVGYHAVWVGPRTQYQFYPFPSTVEAAYLENFTDDRGAALAPGDSFDMAVKELPLDRSLAWDTERGEADGELAWDVAMETHTLRGSYGGHSSESEVIFVRAELYAKGGDVDARDGSIQTPPLMIDLPRIYGPLANAAATTASFTPYLHYLRDLEGAVQPQLGKAVFTAKTRGYLPEGKVEVLPNGKRIREWHIPLDIIIHVTGRTGSLESQSSLSMPSGGLVQTFGSEELLSERIPAGATVRTNGSGDIEVTEGESSQTSTSGSLYDDIKGASQVDASLDRPVELSLAKRSLGITLDPDFEGTGTLAVTDAHDERSGKRFFKALAVPFVEVDGETIPLDRSRLLELQVLPLFDYIGICFTGRADGDATLDPVSYSRARCGRIFKPGLTLRAVYDLGGGLLGMLVIYEEHDHVDSRAVMQSQFYVLSLSGNEVSFRSTQYMELDDRDGVLYNGAPVTAEFTDVARVLQVGDARVGGSATGGAAMTIVRADRVLEGDPIPDPSVTFDGRGIGVYLRALSPSSSGRSFSSIASSIQGLGADTTYDVPPVGESCTDPVVVDDADPLPGALFAGGHLDVQRSWFDYDGSNLYATIEVSQLNASAVSPATYRTSWRLDHIGYGLQAAVNALGEWSFGIGLHGSAGSPWNRIGAATGEVAYGSPGYIRIKAPALVGLASPFLPGEVFRDTGAVSFDANNRAVDTAPQGAADSAYGRGADWVVGHCDQGRIDTLLEILDLPLTGQHSDELPVTARLTAADGEPVVGQQVRFVLEGVEIFAVTDESGTAGAMFPLEMAPGAYELVVLFEGAPGLEPAGARAPVDVLREDSLLTLELSGQGVGRVVTASLVDADEPSSGLNGRTVEFFVDGESIGTAVTDEEGTATFQVPPRYRGSKQMFTARYAGDDFYVAAEASTSD